MQKIRQICKKINRKPRDKYNILTFATHESYQTLLSNTGHNFFLLNRPGAKTWDTRFRPIPENHIELNEWFDDIHIDFILSQQRFDQLQFARALSRRTRLPIVHMEHVEPQLDKWKPEEFEKLCQLHGDVNVFITKHNKASWKSEDGIVIPHAIDTDIFQGWNPNREKPYVLYVVNQLKDRDYFCGYEVWKTIKEKIQVKYPELEFRLVGDNGDMGRPANNVDELVKQYQGCVCYLNTSQLSPIPMSLLEAMSVGCPIVTTAKQEIPRLLGYNHGESIIYFENGFCSNDVDILVEGIEHYYKPKKPEWATDVGQSVREIVLKDYNLTNFVTNWNKVFKQAYDINIGQAYENKV